MATILDVANLAGVSQGTVSNVLNRKGNVSSEKIKAVEEAAKKLGFTINEKAKMLRKGSSNIITVVLPNIQFRHYRDFYTSLKAYAEKHGYTINLLVTNDNPEEELLLIQQAKSAMTESLAVFTCLEEKENRYEQAGFTKVCFVERRPEFPADYYGFDYTLASSEMAEDVKKHGYKKVLLFTGSARFSNEREFSESFKNILEKPGLCCVVQIETDAKRIGHSALNALIGEQEIDAVFTTNIGFAEKIRQIRNSFYGSGLLPVYTISPVFTLPEKDYKKYELNYSFLGREVAEHLIGLMRSEASAPMAYGNHIMDNDGQRKWHQIGLKKKGVDCLNVLALESPEASAMKALSRLYTEKTGTEIKIAVFSYEEIYESFVNSEDFGIFDVFRIDVTWLSWFAEKILLPIDEIDPDISMVFPEYIPALTDKYSRVNGRVYALPVSPSAQLLLYRKDLFEDVAVMRQYQELYKEELKAPLNFEEFNRIAGFFTRRVNDRAPTKYGTSLTLGNTGVAATEFLTRFFSYAQNLYDENGQIVLNNKAGIRAMKDLLEARRYISSASVPWWTDSARAFSDGDVAMSIMFSNYASEILGYHSKIIDKVGYAHVPGKNPLVGGGSLGIARKSRYPEDGLAFIKWMTKDPAASALAALGSVSPCRKTYEIYDIVNAFPWLELSKECFAMSKTRRLPPDNKRPFDERKFLSILGTAVKNVMAEVMSPETALELAQRAVDRDFIN